jgi:hypothetical protein
MRAANHIDTRLRRTDERSANRLLLINPLMEQSYHALHGATSSKWGMRVFLVVLASQFMRRSGLVEGGLAGCECFEAAVPRRQQKGHAACQEEFGPPRAAYSMPSEPRRGKARRGSLPLPACSCGRSVDPISVTASAMHDAGVFFPKCDWPASCGLFLCGMS